MWAPGITPTYSLETDNRWCSISQHGKHDHRYGLSHSFAAAGDGASWCRETGGSTRDRDALLQEEPVPYHTRRNRSSVESSLVLRRVTARQRLPRSHRGTGPSPAHRTPSRTFFALRDDPSRLCPHDYGHAVLTRPVPRSETLPAFAMNHPPGYRVEHASCLSEMSGRGRRAGSRERLHSPPPASIGEGVSQARGVSHLSVAGCSLHATENAGLSRDLPSAADVCLVPFSQRSLYNGGGGGEGASKRDSPR